MDCENLLREAHHRGANDLQLVVSLLSLMARQAGDREQSALLLEAASRVRLLARSRAAMTNGTVRDLYAALGDVCEALQTMASPRGIDVTLLLNAQPDGFNADAVTAIGMAVNELATNAIKHAFSSTGAGTVTVSLADGPDGAVVICVDDDGSPLAHGSDPPPRGGGLGLNLARALLTPYGRLTVPAGASKRFEIVLDAPSPPRLN